ncbi:MAG: HEPN domain-containing protein [Candidatus Freyarchaeota archaeon]
MDFLKKNAYGFLDEAVDAFKRKDYKFTMFFVEQFFQLALKYVLAKKYGEFPKTHSLKTLINLTKDKKLINYYKENLRLFRETELSHIASRYMDVDYDEEVARSALNLAEEFKKALG